MKSRGFTIDFNLEVKKNRNPYNLEIVDVHRFEGRSFRVVVDDCH